MMYNERAYIIRRERDDGQPYITPRIGFSRHRSARSAVTIIYEYAPLDHLLQTLTLVCDTIRHVTRAVGTHGKSAK